MTREIHVQVDGPATAKAFADFLIDFVASRGRVTVALSGGSTPKLLFDLLAQEPESIDWSKVHLFWGDERCVPPNDNDSNFKMTQEHLLDHIQIPESNIHRVLGENDPQEEANRYGDEVSAHCEIVDGLPSIDLMILGMGDDGHTASIFPHEMELLTSESVCAVATHPTSGQKRVTLTGPVLNNAAVVAFLVTGEKKAEKIRAIFNKEANADQYPANHIVARSDLHWFVDKGAHALI